MKRKIYTRIGNRGTAYEITSKSKAFATSDAARTSFADRLKNHVRNIRMKLKRSASVFF
jgi:hypothetical protein